MGVVGFCYLQSSAQAISPDSLVLHLPFDGNTLDVSGNNYNGTSSNTVFSAGANGQANSAIEFNGSDSYVTIPNVTQLDGKLTDYTILVRMWVATLAQQPGVQAPYTTSYNFLYWHRNASDSGTAFIQSKLKACWQGPGANLPYSAFLGYLMSWCTGNIGTSSGYNRSQNEIVGRWFTFAMRYHRGVMDIYHNCDPTNHVTGFYPVVSDLCGTDPMQLTLGLVPKAAFQYGYRYFNGKIDDLRVYRRALTTDEILRYTDTTCSKIPVPTLRIQVKTPDPCSPEQIVAKDASLLNGDSLISRTWRIYSDSSRADSIAYQFVQAGQQRIRLSYTTKSGVYTTDTLITISQLGRTRFLKATASTVALCEGASTQLEVTGGSNYQWEPCTSLDRCNAAQVITAAKQNTRYKISGSLPNGCTDSTYIEVKIIQDTAKVWVATAFSPNGDGLNETFDLLHFSPLQQQHIEVYNRWGQAIFRSQPATLAWDGRLNSTPQPAGPYPWMARYSTGAGCPEKRISGTVWLIR